MQDRKKEAITLIELILAILLMGTIVLAGYSLELTMRNMSVAPRVEAKLLDELVPIMEMIKKSFEFESTGNVLSAPTSFPTRVFGNPPGPGPKCKMGGGSDDDGLEINVGTVRQGYCWKGNSGSNANEFWFYPDSSSSSNIKVIGYGITNFAYDLHPAENGTRLSVEISTRKNPAQPTDPVHPLTNPEVALNQTFYARAVSGA